MAASERDDGVGTPHRPEHAGLFEPGPDYGFAAGLDYTRADKEVVASKLVEICSQPTRRSHVQELERFAEDLSLLLDACDVEWVRHRDVREATVGEQDMLKTETVERAEGETARLTEPELVQASAQLSDALGAVRHARDTAGWTNILGHDASHLDRGCSVAS